jgi:hypothetical protein
MTRFGVFSLVVPGLAAEPALPKRFRTAPAVAAASGVGLAPQGNGVDLEQQHRRGQRFCGGSHGAT